MGIANHSRASVRAGRSTLNPYVPGETERQSGHRRGRPRARGTRQSTRARHQRIRPRVGRARTALHAAGVRRRIPADEFEQLPVAVASPADAPRRRRGRACVRRGTGWGAVHRRHVRASHRPGEADRRFTGRPAAKAFNSAYTTVLGTAIALSGADTYWIGDALNHNCIIRAMRIANVPSDRRAIFAHNRPDDLASKLEAVPDGISRIVVIFDGIFSMRGDAAPLAEILKATSAHESRFCDGVITMMDDSHGIGAYGATGRGTEEHAGARVGCAHRDLRQGVRRQRRVRGFESGARGSGAAEGRFRTSTRIRSARPTAAAAVEAVGIADGPGGPRSAREPRGAHRSVSLRAWRRSDSNPSPDRTLWFRCSFATPPACARWCRACSSEKSWPWV